MLENRPAIYLAGFTDEELISYATQYAATSLEIQLLQRLIAREEKKCGPDASDVCQCCGSSV